MRFVVSPIADLKAGNSIAASNAKAARTISTFVSVNAMIRRILKRGFMAAAFNLIIAICQWLWPLARDSA